MKSLSNGRQVLDCASPLALSNCGQPIKSGRGLPQSKTLSRPPQTLFGSWPQCAFKVVGQGFP